MGEIWQRDRAFTTNRAVLLRITAIFFSEASGAPVRTEFIPSSRDNMNEQAAIFLDFKSREDLIRFSAEVENCMT
jgi:hypothetical protein